MTPPCHMIVVPFGTPFVICATTPAMLGAGVPPGRGGYAGGGAIGGGVGSVHAGGLTLGDRAAPAAALQRQRDQQLREEKAEPTSHPHGGRRSLSTLPFSILWEHRGSA